MKNTRKLIPAIAMLLISAVMMSTASFAWFSSNTKATVDGFNAQIAAANTLLVKESSADNSTYSTSYNFEIEELNMAPTSAMKVADPTFYVITENGAGDIAPGSSAFDPNGTVFEDDDKDSKYNYIHESVTFRATGGEAGDDLGKFTVKITATQKAVSDINKSFRIMLVLDDTTPFYINPFGSEAVKPIESIDSTSGHGKEATTAVSQDRTATNLTEALEVLASFTSEATHKVDIYMWYEGQDTSCFANNAVALKDITVTFEFALVAATGGTNP